MLLHVVTGMTVLILSLHSYILGMCGLRWGGGGGQSEIECLFFTKYQLLSDALK
jgi:hypothetical protein